MLDSISIYTALDCGLIPEAYRNELKNILKCNVCGSDLVVNRNLTTLKCNNLKCPDKIAGRVLKAIKPFNLKGIGPEYIRGYINNNKITSVPEALTSDLLKPSFDAWRMEPHTIGEIIKELAIPGFDSGKTEVLTDNFPNFTAFKYAVLVHATKFFCKEYHMQASNEFARKIGKYLFRTEEQEASGEVRIEDFNREISAYSEDYNKYKFSFTSFKNLDSYFIDLGLELLFTENLSEKEGRNYTRAFQKYWPEMVEMFKLCEQRTINGVIVDIVISNDITRTSLPDGRLPDKDEYVAYINKQLASEGIFVRHAKKRESCAFVVVDRRDGSKSEQAGRRRNNLIYSDELIPKLIEYCKNRKE